MKTIFAIAVFFVTTGLQAQIYTEDGRYELIGKDNKDIFKATGSPYLNDDFSPGKIYFEGKPPLSVHLRYNIYSEIIEIKPDLASVEIFKVSDREKATYELNGKRIIYEQFFHEDRKILGFFISHYEGDRYRLLEKPEIKVSPPVRSESGYSDDKSAKMSKVSSYYILDAKDNSFRVRLKNKDFRKIFLSAAAKEYLSDNRIREIEDLIAFLRHMENHE